MQSNFGKLGFILAALGSSIGLGHIWRFPTLAGNNGGAAFVLLFLTISILVGCSMLIAEMLIGQQGRRNVPDNFKEIQKDEGTNWRFMGIVLFSGPIILTFYSGVLGWVLYYLFSVSFQLPTDFEQSGAIFTSIISGTDKLLYQIICFGVIMLLTAFSVVYGVKGIEKLNYILMPLLFVIFFGLLCYAISLSGFSKSVEFMFSFDITKLNSTVLIQAMGQVFFSLSLGAGAIIAYASHSDKKQNLLSSSLWILFPGIVISLMAGLTIFSFVFEYGTLEDATKSGPGLIFITLPVMFSKFGSFGAILSLAFMAGLLFAGISSTVSLLEPCTKYVCDRTSYSRPLVTYGITLAIFIAGIPVLLSMNADYGELFTFFGKSLFDIMDWLSANILLTWGGFFGAIFIGYFVPRDRLRDWTKGYLSGGLFAFWMFSLRVLAPLMVIIIFVKVIYDAFASS